MIKFTCKDCKESFRVDEKYMVEGKTITCQNCSSQPSSELISLLINYVKSSKETEKLLKIAKLKSDYDEVNQVYRDWQFSPE